MEITSVEYRFKTKDGKEYGLSTVLKDKKVDTILELFKLMGMNCYYTIKEIEKKENG